MLDWKKIEAAASAPIEPKKLFTKVKTKTLIYLLGFAQPDQRGPWLLTYNELFDRVVDGLGIRANRLRQLLEEVSTAPKADRADVLHSALAEMLSNSKRSFRQKQNAA